MIGNNIGEPKGSHSFSFQNPAGFQPFIKHEKGQSYESTNLFYASSAEIKKKTKFSSYIRKFIWDRVQSHI